MESLTDSGLRPFAGRRWADGDVDAEVVDDGAHADAVVGGAARDCTRCVARAEALMPAPVVTSSIRCDRCGAIVIFGRTPVESTPAWYVITPA